jgi:hypothetical protein
MSALLQRRWRMEGDRQLTLRSSGIVPSSDALGLISFRASSKCRHSRILSGRELAPFLDSSSSSCTRVCPGASAAAVVCSERIFCLEGSEVGMTIRFPEEDEPVRVKVGRVASVASEFFDSHGRVTDSLMAARAALTQTSSCQLMHPDAYRAQ